MGGWTELPKLQVWAASSIWNWKKKNLNFLFSPLHLLEVTTSISGADFPHPPQTHWTIITPPHSTLRTLPVTFCISNPAHGTRQHCVPKKPRQNNSTRWKYVICESREDWEQQVSAGGFKEGSGWGWSDASPLPQLQVHSKYSLRTSPPEHTNCVTIFNKFLLYGFPPHFLNLHQLLEPKVSCGTKVHSSAKTSAASELWTSLFLTFLQSLIHIFKAGREGLEAHTISRMKGRNSTMNLYTHTMLWSLAFLITPNVLLEVYNKWALG